MKPDQRCSQLCGNCSSSEEFSSEEKNREGPRWIVISTSEAPCSPEQTKAGGDRSGSQGGGTRSHTLCLTSNKPWFSSQNINDEQLIKDDKQVQAINCLDLSLANIQMHEAWINIFSILPTQSIMLIGTRTLLAQDIVYCIWLRIEKYLLVQVSKVFVHTIKPEREFLNQCKCNSQCH